MKEYKTPIFESIYFEVDSKVMGDPRESDEVVTNPWGDEFESGGEGFNGLTLKA
jgi:hypothetical protein